MQTKSTISGNITVGWLWHEGLEDWTLLLPSPPGSLEQDVPANTSLYFAFGVKNTGYETTNFSINFMGITLVTTLDPDTSFLLELPPIDSGRSRKATEKVQLYVDGDLADEETIRLNIGEPIELTAFPWKWLAIGAFAVTAISVMILGTKKG